MQILGTGTKEQKEKVRQALLLVGADASIINRIEVYNTDCVEKYTWGVTVKRDNLDKTTGFSVLPNLKCHVKGNRIVLAGKNPFLTFTTLHELGHLVRGSSEIEADNFARDTLDAST